MQLTIEQKSKRRVALILAAEERLRKIVELSGLQGKPRGKGDGLDRPQVLVDACGICVGTNLKDEEYKIDDAIDEWNRRVCCRLEEIEEYVIGKVGTIGEAA